MARCTGFGVVMLRRLALAAVLPVLGCQSNPEICNGVAPTCVASQELADQLNAGQSCPSYTYCAPDDGGSGLDGRAVADVTVGDALAPMADSGDSGEGGVCDPATRWPAMLASPIVPWHNESPSDPFSAAGLNLSYDGHGVVPRAYAESVNCALQPLADGGGGVAMAPPSWPPQLFGSWGPGANVVVSVDPTTSDLTSLTFYAGYTGVISFSSRMNGAYGNHTYVLGVGTLQRDGAPMTIDWTAAAPFGEIFDGLLWSFAHWFPAVPSCPADACIWGYASPGGDAGAGEDAYYFSLVPLPLAVGFGTVASGGLPTWIEIDLPAGLPPGALDAGAHD
jgi:hypothetical protein